LFYLPNVAVRQILMPLLLPDAKQNCAVCLRFTAIFSRKGEAVMFRDKLRRGAPAKIARLACAEMFKIANNIRPYEIV
jgi:hypothetical protein